MTHTTPPDLLPLLAIRTAGEQVRYIYEHYPAAKVSNGAAMRIAAAVYYPAKLHYIEESSGLVRISADYMVFSRFLSHCTSISRLGRAYRQPKQTGDYIYASSTRQPVSTKKAVKELLLKFPQAWYNDGVLAEKSLQYFPVPGVNCIYDATAKLVELSGPKAAVEAALAHLETIMRRSRELRASLENPHKPSHVQQDRAIMAEVSAVQWAVYAKR